MSSDLSVQVTLSHQSIQAAKFLEEPIYSVLDISPVATSDVGMTHTPLNIVILLDASGTMHHFQLTDEEREYWMGIAISRDEMERGEADESDAVYWTGQTLAEMQSVARTAMSSVIEAIKQLLGTLLPSDCASVIAFADRVHTVFGADEWVNFPERCLQQLDLLREQHLPVDIGTGTIMAPGLLASSDALKHYNSPTSVNRLVIISDGIVQDAEASLSNIATLQDDGFSITTIGVGTEFDEEFLTRTADNSRGEYRYAADINEITDCLSQEVSELQHIAITDLYIAVRGLNGAVVQDMSLVRPAMSLFDEVFTEDEWMRARIGSVSSISPASILLQLAPSDLQVGSQPIGEVQFTWNYNPEVTGRGSGSGNKQVEITAQVTDAMEPAVLNPQVIDIVERFHIYKFEREAQRAQERGDIERVREKLGAATRELRRIGEDDLAADMEQQIATLGTSASDPKRVKRIKATTRRLVSQSDASVSTH